MPTYVYRKRDGEKGCRHCAAQFEVVQMMADDALKTCPKCGGAVERVIVPVGIVKSTKALLGDKNLKRHGFTRFVKDAPSRAALGVAVRLPRLPGTVGTAKGAGSKSPAPAIHQSD